jgi:hypothetical protein
VPVRLGDPDDVALRRLRVAVHTSNEHARASEETIATVERAASALQAAGAVV